MDNSIEIARLLILSTAHLTEETATKMDEGRDIGHPYDTVKYGYEMWVPTILQEIVDVREKGVPGEIVNAFLLAFKYDCRYIRFDRDADTTEQLNTYDW